MLCSSWALHPLTGGFLSAAQWKYINPNKEISLWSVQARPLDRPRYAGVPERVTRQDGEDAEWWRNKHREREEWNDGGRGENMGGEGWPETGVRFCLNNYPYRAELSISASLLFLFLLSVLGSRTLGWNPPDRRSRHTSSQSPASPAQRSHHGGHQEKDADAETGQGERHRPGRAGGDWQEGSRGQMQTGGSRKGLRRYKIEFIIRIKVWGLGMKTGFKLLFGPRWESFKNRDTELKWVFLSESVKQRDTVSIVKGAMQINWTELSRHQKHGICIQSFMELRMSPLEFTKCEGFLCHQDSVVGKATLCRTQPSARISCYICPTWERTHTRSSIMQTGIYKCTMKRCDDKGCIFRGGHRRISMD